MSDDITQTRLSMRLDSYLREYMGKQSGKDSLSTEEWDGVWRAADVARTQQELTPEIVDNVRLALQRL
jgi:hypothetical protein